MMLLICEHRDGQGEEDCQDEAEFGHFILEGYPGAEVTPMCRKHKCDECLPMAEALLKQTTAIYGGFDLLVGFRDGAPYIVKDAKDGETGKVSREYFSARLDLELTELAFEEAQSKERRQRNVSAQLEASLPKFVRVDGKKKKH
jgi:hypothetical protein